MRYSLGDFSVDTRHLKLGREGAMVGLDARMAKLLDLLFAAYPQSCSRSFLLERLWPDTVVSDWSLSRLVSDFRKLCQDNGQQQPLIQTLKGRGYRLDSLVWEAQQGSAAPAISARGRWRLPTLASLGALVLAMAAGLGWQKIPSAPLQIGEPADALGRILWVDDHPENNTTERRYLQAKGIGTYTARSTEEALTILAMHNHDAVITDMGRGDDVLAGMRLVEAMRERGDKTPVFVYTILPSHTKVRLVQEKGAQGIAFDSASLYQQILPLFEEPTQPALALSALER
ncbi:winged helix-turn-helix domain-containing protein [Gallaecimonas xiamenensis]|uniref:winged helix-turn-helix domain-containing protein n=1 Tax=Gallaecimonas xiamenensis TaxID=1207039 RepID=UPI000685F3D9|nr:winged helix-turn-helix domain-containing protein [Gallaecimonas xiamenensis]